MKKFLAIVLCLMLAAVPAIGEMTGAIPVEMAFATPSTEFSIMSAWYVLSTFNGFGEQDTAQLMQNAGLEVALQANYDKPMSDHSHTSAFTLATGQMPVRGEMRNVAVITVRGTGDGEWYSNFDFAAEKGLDGMYAENFYAAAEDIYAQAKPVLDGMESPVIIATGYSRGAACANLLGLMINGDFDMQDVYVYTYASPNTVRFDAENDENIFNLVNVNDMFTNMPFEVWGFKRPGTDIELRDPEYVNVEMHQMFMAMLGVCPDINSYYNDRHAVDTTGLSDDGITVYELLQLFADMTSGDEALAANAQQVFMAISASPNDFSGFLSQFMMMMNATGENNTASVATQHNPETYVQLMMQLGF